MESSESDYVHLRVRERRFIGKWIALKNVIIANQSVFKSTQNFFVPLNHLLINGLPNKFLPVKFNREGVFQLINTENDVAVKPIRYYRALTAEMSDNHIDVLTEALIKNGCCQECEDKSYEVNIYRP